MLSAQWIILRNGLEQLQRQWARHKAVTGTSVRASAAKGTGRQAATATKQQPAAKQQSAAGRSSLLPRSSLCNAATAAMGEQTMTGVQDPGGACAALSRAGALVGS